MEDLYLAEKENKFKRDKSKPKRCGHYRTKENVTSQRSRSSMDHIARRSPILDTTPT
jgi:hypothetical protein